jgi:hypothetical protein
MIYVILRIYTYLLVSTDLTEGKNIYLAAPLRHIR